ncbi:unnamed protein product [Ilex paraguariensis]|uniref:RING-type domain-containing protein n=1 Tax=Ilex paraguariensis TaxID=185542 RepID=A0ABC8SP84_9AQUA
MGSSSSRGSCPRPRPRPQGTIRRTLSALLICGASTSHTPTEMEDDPTELLVNSAEHGNLIVNKFKSSTKESGAGFGFTCPKIETGTSSDCSMEASEDPSFQGGAGIVGKSNQGKYLSESKELFPPHQLSADYNGNTASTSNEHRPSTEPVVVNGRANIDVLNGINNTVNGDVPQICVGVPCPSNPSSPGWDDSASDGASVENHVNEMLAYPSSGPVSASMVSNSPVTFHSPLPRDDTLQETIPSDLGFLVSERDRGLSDDSVLHVDVVSVSSNILSSSSAEISNREARRNSRRLFWDAFSRRSSRRHRDSRTFVFSTDDSDDLGFHDRWLLDFSGDFFDDGVRGDSVYFGSRTHSINEHRWHSRSELWERLHGGLDGSNHRTAMCPTGIHPDGTCFCESNATADESGTRASISRVVMLAEALFEVLDEIHRQPMSLSLSMVSLPASESVVDSFPVKNHRKAETPEMADDVAQCYICLAEYEEGDKIRVLPCHHEYHKSCVDKWLKEIHGVCPLCRGDVREGLPEDSVWNSEIPLL